MTLLLPGALFALVLLPLVALLHLRRRSQQIEEVPSLEIWREILDEAASRGSRARLSLPPSLMVQLLVIAAVVLSLAEPVQQSGGGFRAEVFVLDNSYRMAATDVLPSRLDAARRIIRQRVQQAPSGTRYTIVTAGDQPRVLISSSLRGTVLQALDSVQTIVAPANLRVAFELAAAMASGTGSRITVLYAREEQPMRITKGTASLSNLPIGVSSQNQSIVAYPIRCLSASTATCMAYVAVRNEDTRPASVAVVVDGNAQALAQRRVTVPGQAETGISFAVPAGIDRFHIYLQHHDILAADDSAFAAVPAPVPLHVTIVGDTAPESPIRQALSSIPGISLRVFAPAAYASALKSPGTLLLLDGWVPPGGLPAVPALLLVDPPAIHGGIVGGTLADTTVSGLDISSELLGGVDLTSLDITAGAARKVILPKGISAVAWGASGPLIGAGTVGGTRVVVLPFDPSRSNLPELSAFPLLLQNILTWSGSWLPPTARAGDLISVDAPPGTQEVTVARGAGGQTADATFHGGLGTLAIGQPGLYTVTERGVWGARSGIVAANLDLNVSSTSTSIGLGRLAEPGPGAATAGSGAERTAWWPWIICAAAALVASELLYTSLWKQGR